jgi:hypothetical protein
MFLKILKSIFLILGILVFAVILVVAYFLYQGYKSGDLAGYLAKTAVETVVDVDKLTPTQQRYLEDGDFEALSQDIAENITPEQVDCAVSILGEKRAEEIAEKKDPTPQEMLQLSKCL